MRFSLQALGHDPVRLGHPWKPGGFTRKTQHAQTVTRSLTYQKGGLHFKFWSLLGPAPPPTMDSLNVREGQSGRKDVRGGYFGPPPSCCNWISIPGFQVTGSGYCHPAGRPRKRASRCRGLEMWHCGVEVKAEFLCNRRPCPPNHHHKTTAAARERGDRVLVLRCI